MAYNPCPTGCTYEQPKITNPACSVFNDELISQIRFSYSDKPLTSVRPIKGDASYATQQTARATEWTTRLDNTADSTTKPNAIRFWNIEDGVLPATDRATKTTASGQIIAARKTTQTITFVYDDDSDEAYEFLSSLTDCPKQRMFWFVSGAHIYGDKGILGTFLAAYKIDDTGVGHSWAVTVSFNTRGAIPRDPFTV